MPQFSSRNEDSKREADHSHSGGRVLPWRAPGVLERMPLGALRKDGCGGEPGGQRAPEEDVGVEVDKGLILQAVGDELAKSPPALIGVAEVIEFGGDVGEVETEAVNQEGLAFAVGDEHGLRELPLGETQRESPGQQVMAGLSPDAAFVGLVGL